MIVNSNISPNADLRKCACKFEMIDESDNVFDFSERVIEASTVHEYSEGTDFVRCESMITLNNDDHFFDITNSENIINQFSKRTLAKTYFSTVDYRQNNEFILKSTSYLSDFSFSKKEIDMNFEDLFSCYDFGADTFLSSYEKKNGLMPDTINYEFERQTRTQCVMSQEVLNLYNQFKPYWLRKNGNYISQKDSIRNLSAQLNHHITSGKTVIDFINQFGELEYKAIDDISCATLSESEYVDFEISRSETSVPNPIGILNSRGIITFELGDVVTICNYGRNYEMRIYRIAYEFQCGSLSSEIKGYIL